MSNHGKGNRQSDWFIKQNFYTYPNPIRGNNFINGSYDHNSDLDTWNTYGYAIFDNINNKSYKFGSIRIITKNNNNKFFTGPGYCKFEIFGKNQENLWILLDKFKVGKPDGSLDYYADITNVNDLIYLTRNFGNNKFYNSYLIKNTEISENFKFPIIEIEWDEYSTSLNIYSFPNSVLADGTGNGYENGKHLFVNQNSDLVITFFGGEELHSDDYKQLVSSITYKVGDNGDEILLPESDTAIQLANNTITLSKIIATSVSNVHVIITLKSPDGTVSTSPLVAIIPSSDVGEPQEVPTGRYVRVNVFAQNGSYSSFFPRIALFTSVENATSHTPTGNSGVPGNQNGDLVHYAYTLDPNNITTVSGSGSASNIHTQLSADLYYNSWQSQTGLHTLTNSWQGNASSARTGTVYQIDLGESFEIKAVNLGWMRQYGNKHGYNKTLIEFKIGDTLSDMKPFYVGWPTDNNGDTADGKYWTHEPTRSNSGFTNQYLEEDLSSTTWTTPFSQSNGLYVKGTQPGSNGAVTCTTSYNSPPIPESWEYSIFSGAIDF